MEYVFGSTDRGGVTVETLKTVGKGSGVLEGFVSVMRQFDGGRRMVDTFRVLEHVRHAEGADGRRYNWYTIDNHYRYTEQDTSPEAEQLRADVDYLAVMGGVEL